MKTGKIMDGSGKIKLPSTKTAKIVDGSYGIRGIELFLKPLEEVVDAGAAYGHFER